jgi:hypothetical protein
LLSTLACNPNSPRGWVGLAWSFQNPASQRLGKRIMIGSTGYHRRAVSSLSLHSMYLTEKTGRLPVFARRFSIGRCAALMASFQLDRRMKFGCTKFTRSPWKEGSEARESSRPWRGRTGLAVNPSRG